MKMKLQRMIKKRFKLPYIIKLVRLFNILIPTNVLHAILKNNKVWTKYPEQSN